MRPKASDPFMGVASLSYWADREEEEVLRRISAFRIVDCFFCMCPTVSF